MSTLNSELALHHSAVDRATTAVTHAYRADIDGIRALAVLAVIGFHAFPNFILGGFVGVDVFFVISGYLITKMLLASARGGGIDLRDFYRRRVRRILPALLVVLTACAITAWLVLLSDEFKQLGRHLLGGTLFASNAVLWHESGYFDRPSEAKPLLHLWSLGIEEQFYIVLPLVLLVCLRWRLREGRVMLAMAVVSLGCCIALTGTDRIGSFYSPLTRFWELLAGSLLAHSAGLAAIAHPHTLAGPSWRGRRNSLVSVAGAALTGAAILTYDGAMAYPGVRAVLPVAGTALLIAAGPDAFLNRRVLSMPWLVGIGRISYPLYLWHWPLLKFLSITQGNLSSAQWRIGIVGLSFALAWLTYRFIESPIRRQARAVTIHLWLLATIGLFGFGATSGLIAPRQHAVDLERIVNATTDWQFPSPDFPPMRYEGNRFFQQRTGREQTTLFIGDSNVEQYAPRINAVLRTDAAHANSAVFATHGGCLPIPGRQTESFACAPRLESALRFAQRPEVDTVVIGGYWPSLADGPSRAEALQSLAKLIAQLTRNKRVFLLLPIPGGPEFDPHNMFLGSRWTQLQPKRNPEVFPLGKFIAEQGDLLRALTAIGQANGATVIDPIPSLCQRLTCNVLDPDGLPLYMDEHHMRPFHALRNAIYIDQTVHPADALLGTGGHASGSREFRGPQAARL